MSKQPSEINLKIFMDDNNLPETIEWFATDGPDDSWQRSKAAFVSLWDAESRNSLRIDLWTKDMSIHDMNDFFFQTFLTLADTYKNATQNTELMAEIKMFAREFAEKAAKMEEKKQGIG